MNIIENVFVSNNVDDVGTVIYSLKRKIPVFNVFCICVNFSSKNTFEVLSTKELFHKRNIEKDYYIAGIAMGKYDAYVLIKEIFQYGEENNCNHKDFKKVVCGL